MPWNGPRERPADSSASSSRAVARAPSASTVMKLRILPASRATRVLASAALILLATLSARAEGQPACAPTRPDMLGPFYEPDAPERSVTGRGLTVTGRVSAAKGCAPLPAARIEWWSAGPRGDY